MRRRSGFVEVGAIEFRQPHLGKLHVGRCLSVTPLHYFFNHRSLFCQSKTATNLSYRFGGLKQAGRSMKSACK